MKLISKILIVLFCQFSLTIVTNAQTGTANGTYNFTSVSTTNDSHSPGFKTQGDKFAVNNNAATYNTVPPAIADFANTMRDFSTDATNGSGVGNIVIKAEGGSTCKTFTLKDMGFYFNGTASQNRVINTMTVTIKDYNSNVIATHSLSSNYTVPTRTLFNLSSFPFSTAFPTAGYTGVAQLEFSYTLTTNGNTITNGSSLLFRSITLEDISASLSPTITSFSPTSAKPGDVVTISGTNFNTTPSNNIVFFGATKASVTAASTTQLTVTVPTGATYGAISELNTSNKLACYSLSNFNPIYSPSKTSFTSADFSAPVNFAADRNSISSSLSDLDGDGKSDLLVTNFNAKTIFVYKNTSSLGVIDANSFASPIALTTNTQPYNTAIGDLDGDGKPDVVVPNFSSNNISVFVNTSTIGNISFAGKVDFASNAYPRFVAINDLDGDGKLDIIVTNNATSGGFTVYLNTSTAGNLSFATKVDFIISGGCAGLSCNDIDGDKKPDLVIVNQTTKTTSVLRNTSTSGNISFATKIDIAVAANPSPLLVAVADIDGDSKLDIAVANFGGNTSVSVLRNTSTSGNISFMPKFDLDAGAPIYSVSFGDVDGDGKVDLFAIANTRNSFSLFRNIATNGSITTSSFATRIDFTAGTGVANVAIGDIDGDGLPDLAVANNTSNNVSILRNTSTLLTPTITTTGTLNGFSTCAGIASATQSFTVSGSNLTNDVVVTAPTGYEVSLSSGSGYSSSVTLTQSGGTVATTTIYARLASTATGSPSGNITLASTGVTAQNIAVSGTVNTLPTITLGSVSSVLTTSTSFSLPYTATTGSPNQYSISTGTPTAMSGFTAVNNASLPVSPISVTIPASAANTYNFNLTLKNGSSGCVSSSVPFTVTVAAPAPVINTTGTLNGFSTCAGIASAAQSFTVSGSNLTSNLVVTPPSGYEITNFLASGPYGTSSISMTPTFGTVPSTTFYVRLISSATGSPSGNITLASTGVTAQNIAVSGTVNTLPTITLGSVSSVLTTSTSFSLPYTATTGSPNQYSISTGTPTAMSGFTAVNNASLPVSPISVTIPASAANTYNFNLTLKNGSSGCVSSSVPFTVTVAAPAPVINTTGTLNGFSTCAGIASAAQSFTVSGSNLTSNLVVTPPSGYEITNFLASGPYGTSSISMTPTFGTVPSTTFYVRLISSATGSPSGNITLASTGVTAQNIAVSGTVNALPNTSINVTESSGTTNNDGNICNGSSVTLNVTGLDGSSTVLWSNGATSNGITVSPASTTTYTATVTNASGCAKTSSVTVTVNALPSGSVSVVETSGNVANDGIICSGAGVQLTASGIDGSSSFFWSTGQFTNSISYNPTSTITFTLTVTNNTTGCMLSVPKTITVNSVPTITLGTVSNVLPTSTSFSLPYTATTGSPTMYGIVAATPNAMSGFANVNSATLGSSPISVTIPASAAGTYNFNIRVVNSSSCFSSFVPFTVTVGAPASATVTATGSLNGFSACSGAASAAQSFTVGGANLSNNVTVTAPTGYEVSLASGSGYTSSITLTQSGGTVASTTIYARLAATATGTPSGNITVASTGASTQNIAVSGTVNALPNTSITVVESSGTTNNDGTICNGSSVTLNVTGLDGSSTVLWSNGATSNGITVSPASTTTYTATVTNASVCAKTSSVTITVNPLPTPSISAGSATTFCQGGSVTLTASTGTSYLWSTGATTASINASTSGNYTVTVTNANGCSATSAATTVTVNSLPTATISAGSATTFCQGGSVTLTASTGTSYLWSTGATTASINASTSGNYTVTVTNANGCSATSAATTVTVNPLPTASISAGSATTFCQGGSVTLTASTGTSYLWSTGATTASINASTSGNYTVTVTNANGCSATSAATTVTVNPLPTASISAGSATTFCQGGSVTLTASTGTSYLWSTGATTASINASTSGNYTVTVTNANGCSATSAATTVTVNPLPTASISAGSATTFCQGGSVTLTASTGTSYLWSTGATTASINVSTSGNYTVTVTNANGCSATSAATTVTVNSLPTASISGTTAVCQNAAAPSITFTGASGTAPYTFSYKINGGTTQTVTTTTSGNSVTVSVPTSVAGSFAYSLVSVQDASSTSCSNAATGTATTVTVNPLPAASISGTTAICQNSATPSITFTGSAGTAPYTFSYKINGGTTQTVTTTSGNSVTVSVPTSVAGSFAYSLVSVQDASSTSCSNAATDTATVTVNPLPTASISGTTAICQNAVAPSITFTGSAGTAPYTFSYKINGGTTQTVTTTSGNSVTVSVPTSVAGSFAYSLVSVQDASSTSCSNAATGTATVTVNPLPTASISGTTAICQNAVAPSITFTGASGTAPYTFSYKINGGTTQTVTTISGNSVTVSVPTSVAGSFAYSLVSVQDASSTSCSNAATGTATVTVNPLPTASISGTTAICQNAATPSITFTGASGTAPYTFSYKINGGTTQTVTTTSGNSVTVSVPTSVAGSFAYSLVSVQDASSTSCSNAATGTATVTVNPLPAASISAASTVICGAGNATNLTATGGATYQWSRNGTTISGATASTYAASIIGTYTATAISSFGCTAPASGSIVVTQLFAPKASFSYDSYCTNKAINFTNASTVNTTGAVSYAWSDNAANTSSATNARFTYPNAGNYSVKLKVQSNTCSNLADSVTVIVPVEAPRVAVRQTTVDVAINDNVQLQARNFGNQYTWSPSFGLSNAFISNPVINTTKEQEYLIAIGVPSGCTTVDTIKVRIHESNKIYVPNVFSPNGDGQNDKLYLIPVGISELKSFRIFSRWGKKLFETSSITQGWDGTFNGQLQPIETYVWTVLAVDKDGKTFYQEGTVTLLR